MQQRALGDLNQSPSPVAQMNRYPARLSTTRAEMPYHRFLIYQMVIARVGDSTVESKP